MVEITITLTDTQYKGLEYASTDPQFWVENVVTERCRIANDEIVQIVVAHCLDNGLQVPATREEIVAYAFSSGVVKTAQQRHDEAVAGAITNNETV